MGLPPWSTGGSHPTETQATCPGLDSTAVGTPGASKDGVSAIRGPSPAAILVILMLEGRGAGTMSVEFAPVPFQSRTLPEEVNATWDPSLVLPTSVALRPAGMATRVSVGRAVTQSVRE